MKALFVSMMACAGLLLGGIAHAQAPATAPAGTTAQCKDGSWYSGETKKGACRGHKGIEEWYGATAAAAPAPNAGTMPRSTKSSRESAGMNAPGAAPPGSTALCKDGTYFSGETRKGACRGHKGIQEWYGANATATAAPMAPAPRSSSMPMSPPPAAAPQAPASPASMPMQHTAARAPAAGGGMGQVWVNSATKVYHCQSDRYYGKTKQGEYMTEADALAKGNHAARGKSCGQ